MQNFHINTKFSTKWSLKGENRVDSCQIWLEKAARVVRFSVVGFGFLAVRCSSWLGNVMCIIEDVSL